MSSPSKLAAAWVSTLCLRDDEAPREDLARDLDALLDRVRREAAAETRAGIVAWLRDVSIAEASGYNMTGRIAAAIEAEETSL